jgi:hypothetical protein
MNSVRDDALTGPVSPGPRSDSNPSDRSSDDSSEDERPKGLIHLPNAEAKKYLVGPYHVVVLCKGDPYFLVIHRNWLLSSQSDDNGKPIYDRCAFPSCTSAIREVTSHPQPFRVGEPFEEYELAHCPHPGKDYFECKLSKHTSSSSVKAATQILTFLYVRASVFATCQLLKLFRNV